MGQPIQRETLKSLREARKAYIARARQTIKKNHKILRSIQEQIAPGPKTIPEIARALGTDTAQVLLFVSALKKYGQVTEGPQDGDYFKYGLTP